MRAELERAGHQLIAVSRLEYLDLLGIDLAVARLQLGLVIEQVHLAGPAILEQQDHRPGLGREMPGAREQIEPLPCRLFGLAGRQQPVAREKMREGQRAEAERRLLQERA